MTAIDIAFDSAEAPPWTEVDFFGIRAAQILADLLPGVMISVTFKRATPCNGLPGARKITYSWKEDPDRIHGWFGQVPGSDDWYREVSVRARDAVRRFLWPDSNSGALRKQPPREIRFAHSICEDVSRAWTINFDADENLPEMRLALSNQLPVCIVSHIAADLCYRFDSYGTGRGNHDVLARTLMSTISYLDNLAGTRVEHQALTHGVVIAPRPTNRRPLNAIYPDDFRILKRTPLLADGIDAALWLTPAANPVGLITQASLRSHGSRKRLRRPSRFGELALLADASSVLKGLAVGLRNNGSLVLFAKGRPTFARRGTSWRGAMWTSVRAAIHRDFKRVGTLLFDAALLLSTTGRGGILGIVHDEAPIAHKDNVQLARARSAANSSPPEWLFHSLLPTDVVTKLGPAALATLASIDGATIVTPAGKLLAYGAVIPSGPAASEGARSAAARSLSEKGFVLKVSADGPITLFQKGAELMEV